MAKVSAVVMIYDIRGFTAASKKLATADLGAFATAAHKVILDLFADRAPTFVKNLGDGHLLIWETTTEPEKELVEFVVSTARKARTTFPAFVAGRIAEEGGIGNLPTRVGIGVVAGEVSKSDDYYGVVVNLAARLQNMARPEGLALDTTTFDRMSNRETLIEQGFKKDRVYLKGLGSTLVWVDRPFSWERVWQKTWPYLAAIAAVLGYILLADIQNSKVPGGAAIRRWLDSHDMSLLRTFEDEATIRATAAKDRRAIAAAMLKAQMSDGRIATELQNPVDPFSSVWGSSQAICGLLTVPHLDAATKRGLVEPYVRYLFAPGIFIEGYGWRSQVEETKLPYAEPALWTVALLARALGTQGVIGAEERPRYMEMLRKAQDAVDNPHYRPLETGGWNIFPNQKIAEQYSPYTTALALHMLLEVHAAGLPWKGSEAAREDLLAKTANFLIGLYEEKSMWGWRRTHQLSVPVSEGLTLQIYSELLRAESESGIVLPPVMLKNIPLHLAKLIERTKDSPYDAGEYMAECTDQTGAARDGAESINFVWHSWAVDAAMRWLERTKRFPAPHEDIVGVRRALSHLIVTMSEDKTKASVEGQSFLGGEALIGLSAVPEP